MSEEKDEYANNLIKHLFSKEGPCGEQAGDWCTLYEYNVPNPACWGVPQSPGE